MWTVSLIRAAYYRADGRGITRGGLATMPTISAAGQGPGGFLRGVLVVARMRIVESTSERA